MKVVLKKGIDELNDENYNRLIAIVEDDFLSTWEEVEANIYIVVEYDESRKEHTDDSTQP